MDTHPLANCLGWQWAVSTVDDLADGLHAPRHNRCDLSRGQQLLAAELLFEIAECLLV
jgi:hypothetical protein